MEASTTTRQETHVANPPPDTGMPRWVKVFGIVGGVLVLLLVLMLLTGHGPNRHTGSHTPPSGVAEQGVRWS
jgi:hypothetical protein